MRGWAWSTGHSTTSSRRSCTLDANNRAIDLSWQMWCRELSRDEGRHGCISALGFSHPAPYHVGVKAPSYPAQSVKRIRSADGIDSVYFKISGHYRMVSVLSSRWVPDGYAATASAQDKADKLQAKERARRSPCGGPCH